jgi:hypothetical protein
MRSTRVVVDLGCQSEVAIHLRTLLVDNDATHARARGLILGDGNRSIFELKLLDGLEVGASLLSCGRHAEGWCSVMMP